MISSGIGCQTAHADWLAFRHGVDAAETERMAAKQAFDGQSPADPWAVALQCRDRVFAATRAELACAYEERSNAELIAADRKDQQGYNEPSKNGYKIIGTRIVIGTSICLDRWRMDHW